MPFFIGPLQIGNLTGDFGSILKSRLAPFGMSGLTRFGAGTRAPTGFTLQQNPFQGAIPTTIQDVLNQVPPVTDVGRREQPESVTDVMALGLPRGGGGDVAAGDLGGGVEGAATGVPSAPPSEGGGGGVGGFGPPSGIAGQAVGGGLPGFGLNTAIGMMSPVAGAVNLGLGALAQQARNPLEFLSMRPQTPTSAPGPQAVPGLPGELGVTQGITGQLGGIDFGGGVAAPAGASEFGGEVSGFGGGPEGAGGVGGDGDGDGGAGTVICTVMHQYGWMSRADWQTDRQFGQRIDPSILRGYHRWAVPLATWLHRSALLRWLIAPLVRAWTQEMVFRMSEFPTRRSSLLGRAIMAVGLPLCAWLGKPSSCKSIPMSS